MTDPSEGSAWKGGTHGQDARPGEDDALAVILAVPLS
jgi:hypothetical protein